MSCINPATNQITIIETNRIFKKCKTCSDRIVELLKKSGITHTVEIMN